MAYSVRGPRHEFQRAQFLAHCHKENSSLAPRTLLSYKHYTTVRARSTRLLLLLRKQATAKHTKTNKPLGHILIDEGVGDNGSVYIFECSMVH